jgi:hypothetical protein
MVTLLVEILRWVVVDLLPAVMGLDKLALNANPLGEVAKGAVASVVYLLPSLTVRAEQVNIDDRNS